MIITCPNCQTRYNIADAALGSAGRKVQCANCTESWLATPDVPAPRPQPRLVETGDRSAEADALFDAVQEAALDDAFEAEEAALREDLSAETAPSHTAGSDLDTDLQRRREQAMDARMQSFKSKLPLARMRRLARFASVVLAVIVLGGAVLLRTELVRAWPDLGEIYETIGLGVNIYGLEIEDAQTLRTMRDGTDVMVITARIRNIGRKSTAIPPVRVSILSVQGESLYQWNARPEADLIGPGEVVSLETQLNSAPQNAARVQLVFSNEREQGRQARASASIGDR